mmetsp:Transcript_80956/g.177702  ORF Transcript_80956/g.177702 Transcript_80956/m.177702 type:complete len:242 (-) Transcript_80956:1240-1965(-)
MLIRKTGCLAISSEMSPIPIQVKKTLPLRLLRVAPSVGKRRPVVPPTLEVKKRGAGNNPTFSVSLSQLRPNATTTRRRNPKTPQRRTQSLNLLLPLQLLVLVGSRLAAQQLPLQPLQLQLPPQKVTPVQLGGSQRLHHRSCQPPPVPPRNLQPRTFRHHQQRRWRQRKALSAAVVVGRVHSLRGPGLRHPRREVATAAAVAVVAVAEDAAWQDEEAKEEAEEEHEEDLLQQHFMGWARGSL